MSRQNTPISLGCARRRLAASPKLTAVLSAQVFFHVFVLLLILLLAALLLAINDRETSLLVNLDLSWSRASISNAQQTRVIRDIAVSTCARQRQVSAHLQDKTRSARLD
jgi:hypothetical protein